VFLALLLIGVHTVASAQAIRRAARDRASFSTCGTTAAAVAYWAATSAGNWVGRALTAVRRDPI
jgi:hypothetical protein